VGCFASADLTRWQVLHFRFESARHNKEHAALGASRLLAVSHLRKIEGKQGSLQWHEFGSLLRVPVRGQRGTIWQMMERRSSAILPSIKV